MNFNTSYILNLYSLFLLLILLITIILKKEDFKFSSRLLKIIIIATSSILVVEILSWAFDSIDATYAKVLNYFFNALFFIAGTGIVGLLVSYVDYRNFKDRARLKKRIYYMHVMILAFILIIINFFYPIVFKITSDNVYSRLPGMNIGFGAVYLLIIYMLVTTYLNRKNLEKQVFASILTFSLIPAIGGILQMFIFGLLIMWAFVGLGVVIAYVYTETISSAKDYLTKLYTRLLMNEYLDNLMHKNEVFTMILIDLDDFKDINDIYGHKEGDMVLINFAGLLKEAFPNEAMLSRIGGDEFLVIILTENINVTMDYLKELYNTTSKYNVAHQTAFIKYSYGIATRIKNSKDTIDELFVRCDRAMYKEKASHKKAKFLAEQ